MNTATKLIAAAALIATASAAAPIPTAEAANTFFTVTCLHNQTKYNLTFYDSQNGGGFTRSFLAPGQTMTYSVKYARANQNKQMVVLVKYDADGTSANFTRTIRLVGYASTGTSCREGKQYAFRPEPRDGRMVMIQTID